MSTPKPLIIRDLPNTNTQMHFHTDGRGNLTGGSIYSYDRQYRIPLNSYECAMADYRADLLNIKKIIK